MCLLSELGWVSSRRGSSNLGIIEQLSAKVILSVPTRGDFKTRLQIL